jgi:hypothetical protein
MAKKHKVNREKEAKLKWQLKTKELPIELTEEQKAIQEQSYAETNGNIELLLNHAINGARLADLVITQFNMYGEGKALFRDITKSFQRADMLICSSVDYEMSKKLRDGITNNYETGILNNILSTYVQLDDKQRDIWDNCGDQILKGMIPKLSKEIDADFDQLNELAKVMQQSLGIVNLEERLNYIKSKGFSIKVTK